MGTAKRERQKVNRQLAIEQMARDARRRKQRKRILTVVIAVPAIAAALWAIVLLSTDDEPSTAADGGTEQTSGDDEGFPYGTGDCAPAEKPDEPVRSFSDDPQLCIDTAGTYSAVVETSEGSFTIDLNTDSSPGTVNNFVTLARYGYYDGTGCHRIIAEFAVQCGRPGDDEAAPGYTIADELPEAGEYTEAVVAMANTGAPDSGGGQFFIIVGADGAGLDPDYSVLGTVSEGYDTTVAALEALADPDAPNGVPPKEPVEIIDVSIVEG